MKCEVLRNFWNSASVLKFCFFDLCQFGGDLFRGDRDAEFFGLALDPDRVEEFAQRRRLQFFVFVVARFRRFFQFRLGGLLQQRPFEVGFADRADVVGHVLDDRDVAGGHARVADALGDRVAGEEDHEERAEDEAARGAADPNFLLCPGFAPTKSAA